MVSQLVTKVDWKAKSIRLSLPFPEPASGCFVCLGSYGPDCNWRRYMSNAEKSTYRPVTLFPGTGTRQSKAAFQQSNPRSLEDMTQTEVIVFMNCMRYNVSLGKERLNNLFICVLRTFRARTWLV